MILRWFECSPIRVSNDDESIWWPMATQWLMMSSIIPFIHQLIFKHPQPKDSQRSKLWGNSPVSGTHSDFGQVI